jgi:uncharacterized protein (TIGR03083 family)
MADIDDWVVALRNSHDHLAGLVGPLTPEQVAGPSHNTEWSIADTASHLGSQAEIFEAFLDAGLSGETPPGGDAFPPIWDRWNAKSPIDQVTDSVAVNDAFVSRLEQLPDADRARFATSFFGNNLDLTGLLGMRLTESALHTWDIAVALNPSETVLAGSVDLLIDTIGAMAARAQPVDDIEPIVIATSAPERSLLLTLSPAVALTPAPAEASSPLHLPAESFIRLVSGRLDPDHTPSTVDADARLDQLRTAFPGF